MLAGWIRRVFKLTLVFTFAITTPIGIAIGLATFGHGKTDAGTPPLFPSSQKETNEYSSSPILYSIPKTDPRSDVRHIGRHVDLCCVRRDACG